jgi:hypothetical protein
MFDAAQKASNGVMVQYVDMGVEYSYNGKTLQILGDATEGEISISDKDYVIGEYGRDYYGTVTHVELEDGREFALESEEDYEAFALKLLTE